MEAVIEIGKLAEKPSEHEDKLRVDKNTGSNLLSLAAQIALEVEQIILSFLCFIDISRTAVTPLTWPSFNICLYFMDFLVFHASTTKVSNVLCNAKQKLF